MKDNLKPKTHYLLRARGTGDLVIAKTWSASPDGKVSLVEAFGWQSEQDVDAVKADYEIVRELPLDQLTQPSASAGTEQCAKALTEWMDQHMNDYAGSTVLGGDPIFSAGWQSAILNIRELLGPSAATKNKVGEVPPQESVLFIRDIHIDREGALEERFAEAAGVQLAPQETVDTGIFGGRPPYPDAAVPKSWDHFGSDRIARPAQFAPGPKTFEEAWAEKEKEGYQYGRDALEQVRFGWEIREQCEKPGRKEISAMSALREIHQYIVGRVDFDTAAGIQRICQRGMRTAQAFEDLLVIAGLAVKANSNRGIATALDDLKLQLERFQRISRAALDLRPVDGGGLPPQEHADLLAKMLDPSESQAATLLAEIRNALVPVDFAAERLTSTELRDKIQKGIRRLFDFCDAIDRYIGEERRGIEIRVAIPVERAQDAFGEIYRALSAVGAEVFAERNSVVTEEQHEDAFQRAIDGAINFQKDKVVIRAVRTVAE
jgi:hypothetical protein